MFGKNFNTIISPMQLCGSNVDWCNTVNYLGVHLITGKELRFDIGYCRRSFYAACISIFAHGSRVDEIALLTLQESYSLPILMYAASALSLTKRQSDELNVCWNNVFRKLFGYNKWESVKAVILGLGRLNVNYLIIVRKIRFYRRLYFNKASFMSRVFNIFLLCASDYLMDTVFKEYDDVMQAVYEQFRMYVNTV